MKVEVRLYGSLRRYRPAGLPGALNAPFTVDLPADATVATLCRHLNIPESLASAAAVNDEAVTTAWALHEGDRASLFPPSAGGQVDLQPRGP